MKYEILGWDYTEETVTIDYFKAEKEMHLLMTTEQFMDYLYKTGIIDDSEGNNISNSRVKWDDQPVYAESVCLEKFIVDLFTDRNALAIVRYHESLIEASKMSIKEIMNSFKTICDEYESNKFPSDAWTEGAKNNPLRKAI
jgi:hypothetical protein